MTETLRRKIITVTVLFMLAAFAGTAFATMKSSLKRITGAELTTMMESGKELVIVDVREPWLYSEGHIPGAINIQYQDNAKARVLKELVHESTIVLVCHSGFMGDELGGILIDNGYRNVYNLKGGMNGWTGPVSK